MTTQPSCRQPPLDHARNNAYRDHRCLRAPNAALPAPPPREREGRRLPGHDHGGVAHEKGQPRRVALPAILTKNGASPPLRHHSQGRGTGGGPQANLTLLRETHWLPNWLPNIYPRYPSDQSGRRDLNPRPLDPQILASSRASSACAGQQAFSSPQRFPVVCRDACPLLYPRCV
jgi:hypothetical protein